ncbi:MAG: ABC transporter substrate-binding protein [Chloroflexi bacterium]|nr:ABC transporter substrate-binding protein [Chloroflexota bacterium]
MPKRVLIAASLVISLAASCAPPTPVQVEPSPPAALPTPVTLAMGYIPSVQFAPFYVALEKGYFAAEGLEVTFRYGFETDLIKLVGTDELQFMIGSGEEVILARAQGLPVTYVMRWYRRFPVVVFALEALGLDSPQALEGKRVGIPGLFGASYIGWKALVYGAGLDESKITLESIGFTQAAAVSEGRVDAALDYSVSGPVQLPLAGKQVDVIYIADVIDLPSNGIITNDKTIAERPQLAQALVRAALRGLQDTMADPDAAFAISLQHVPEAGGDNETVSRAIFDEVLGLWRTGEGEQLGASDPQVWAEASRFMHEMGLVDVEVAAEELFTNQFVQDVGEG